MSTMIPIARYLSGEPASGGPGTPAGRTRAKDENDAQKFWYEKGYRAGQEAASRAAEAALSAEREEHARRVEALRRQWAEGEAEALSAAIATAFARLETRIADAVARVLHPFVKQQAMALALDELRAAIATIITNRQNVQLKITGPDDLVGKVVERLTGVDAVARADPARLEVAVEVGDTLIEVNVEQWYAKLMELARAPG